jgi:hypothetical protein
MSINTGNDYIYKYPFYNVKNTILDNLYNSDIINQYSLEKYNNINNNYKGFLLKLLDIYKIFFNSLDIDIDINKNLNLFNKIIINNIIKEQKNIKEENRLKNKRSYSQISEIKKKSSDIKKKQFKKKYIKPSTTNIRRRNLKIKTKGGNISYNYSNIVKYYLKNQYIFDNKHDFHNLITNNEYKYNENDIKTEDNETITINELKDLYKKDERDIFYNIISKDIDIINNLYYFSIFDSIDIDKTKFYGKSIFEKLDLTDEEVISNLKKDFKLYIEDILNKANYIHDVNLTSGSIDKNLTSSLTKLGLSVDLYNELNNYKEDYVKFVKLLNEYLNDKRIITIVDTYDSASINTIEAQEKLNNYITTDIVNNIAFISNNIYEENNLTAIPDELKDIFKCFNNDTIELFTLGYYIEANGFKTAFIFKNKEIIDRIIQNLTQKNITYNFKKLKKNNNIYEINNNNFDYYAFDLLDNNTRNFNSKNRISNIINNFIDNFKNDNNNIFGFIDNNKILEKNIDYYIISYLYLSNSDFNKKGTEINNNIHKKIAKILFDLKKGGDVAKLLFVFYYNYFDEKSDTNIVNIKNKLIPDVLNFSSNDKLAALASIVRKSNSVLFSDPSIFSIFMYKNNKDKNIDIKKIFSWFKLYFGDILTSKNINIFNKINNLNGNENIKLLNNIIKIINENNIQLYIKKDNINTFNNINIELENIKNNNSDKEDLIQSIEKYLKIFTSQYISQENINNNYIKEILFIYIDDIIENIKNNFKNEIVINYFTEKILFNSIQDLNDTKKYNIIFKEIVKTLLNNIYNIIYKLFDIIKDKIKNTQLDLTDSDNLYDLLIKINSIIKIIEIFLFYTEKNIENKKRKKEENKKETINNIFDFFEDLENYIKNIIFYKYINDIGLIRELNPEKTKTLNLYNVSDFLRVELKQGIFDIKIRDKAIKQEYEIRRNIDSIFNRLLSGINIINYIVIFQKFYMYFDILLNNFKILEDIDIDISFKKYLNELIYYIKKIYYYSYLQIYTLGFELNTEQYINFIFANIRDAITTASNDKFQFNSKKNELDPSIIEENIIKGDEMIKIIEEKISIFKEKVSTFHNNILIENTKNEDIIILITDINPEINIPKKIKEPTEKLKINLDNIFKNINENTIKTDILSKFNKIDDDEGKLIKIEISNENIIIKKIFNIYNFFINNKEINESIIENIYEPSSKMDISHGGGLFNIISLENPLNFKDILKIFN